MISALLVCCALASPARDLPVMVPVDELGPVHHDMKVVVSGRIDDMRLFLGRSDGKYILIYLKDLILVSPTTINFKVGDRIIAQGKYKNKGKVGGKFMTHFMFIDKIMGEPI